jgi:prepilin-type N-terminal cleavage/methylation domain-containing protein
MGRYINIRQSGFTLIEVAIVVLIVTILLGYSVALLPRQQELKQYRALDQEMDHIIEAIIGFAQVNGRLPCPAIPNSGGLEDFDDEFIVDIELGCNNYGGFVPVNTLGLTGRLNLDLLLLDPWGNPYRYYVTAVDFDGDDSSDFTVPGEMQDIGLVDSDGDDYIDLDGRYIICDDNGTSIDDECTGAAEVFGNYDSGPPVVYAGAPFVLLSQGKNWNTVAALDDELENRGSSQTNTDFVNGPRSQR